MTTERPLPADLDVASRMAPEITLAATIAVAGAAMTVQQLPPVIRAAASRRWVRAEGRILRSRVSGINEGSGNIRSAAPLIEYEYVVAGTRHRGDVVRLDGFTYQAAVDARLRYSSGQSVKVWYDPACPTRAVLEPGASSAGIIRATVSLAVLLAGAAWSLSILSAA